MIVGVPFQFVLFEQWKAQRVMDVYASYSDEVQSDLRHLCDEVEAAGLLTLKFPDRLARRNYRLVRADL